LSRFERDFSRIPVHPPDDNTSERGDVAVPDAVQQANDSDTETEAVPARQQFTFSEKLTMFRYRLKRKRMAARRGLSGDELKKAMDHQYQYETWYYVLGGGAKDTTGLSWSPISDIVAVDEFRQDHVSRTDIKPRTIPWLETERPLAVRVPAGSGTITATLLDNQDAADEVAILQEGTMISTGPVKKKGDQVTAHFDALADETIELHAALANENIRGIENSSAVPGGVVWAPPKFSVVISPDPVEKAPVPHARVFGPYKEPLRRVLRKLRKSGARPLEQ
jgi:hypothetical protein